MSIRVFSGLLVLLGAFCFIGCKQQTPQPMAQQIDFRKPLPDGMVALRKIDPSEYPDFGATNRSGSVAGVDRQQPEISFRAEQPGIFSISRYHA